MAKAVDLYIIYQLLKRLTTPFDETDAYELGPVSYTHLRAHET